MRPSDDEEMVVAVGMLMLQQMQMASIAAQVVLDNMDADEAASYADSPRNLFVKL